MFTPREKSPLTQAHVFYLCSYECALKKKKKIEIRRMFARMVCDGGVSQQVSMETGVGTVCVHPGVWVHHLGKVLIASVSLCLI